MKMKFAQLTLAASSLLITTMAVGQGGNPPASTKESKQTSGRGQTAVEQTAKGSMAHTQEPSQQVQQALIALDKHWGESASKGDVATINTILSDYYLGIGPKGEVLDKRQQIADTTATTNVQNGSYTADDYKFAQLAPDVIVVTHRATVKGMQNGKDVTESHRSLHVFQKQQGQWKVVANAQLPIQQ